MTRTASPHVPEIANAGWAGRSIATQPVTTWALRATRELTLAMLAWYGRDRERRALAGLDARMLRDIGLTRADVHVEVEKRFWER